MLLFSAGSLCVILRQEYVCMYHEGLIVAYEY